MTVERFIREPEILERLPFSRPTLYRKVREGTFPAPIKLGTRASAWISTEIDAWEKKLIAERDAKVAERAKARDEAKAERAKR
jgi:prophage regulatory protein